MGVESQSKYHWEKVYQSKSPDQVSWFQEHAGKSLEMIRSVRSSLADRIIDVGGGVSTLVDDLLADGCENVSVLDLSEAALNVARTRQGLPPFELAVSLATFEMSPCPRPHSTSGTTGPCSTS